MNISLVLIGIVLLVILLMFSFKVARLVIFGAGIYLISKILYHWYNIISHYIN